MATNIVNASAAPVGGNAWQTVGAGAQGLAGLLAGVMGAREAQKKAAGMVPIPKPIDINMDLGLPAPPAMDPGVLGNPAADLAKLTAQAPAPPTPDFMTGGPLPRTGLPSTGFATVYAKRFPGLFPKASTNLMQYGGL